MWIMALVVMLFLSSGKNAAVGGDFASMIVAFAISAGLVMGAVYFFRQQSMSNLFLNGLVENIREVEMGTAAYEDTTISMDTETAQFEACISALVITTLNSSRHLVVGHHSIFFTGLVYSLITLLLGWWGLPWGPIYTLQTLSRNLRGGHRRTVGEIVEQLRTAAASAENQTLTCDLPSTHVYAKRVPEGATS